MAHMLTSATAARKLTKHDGRGARLPPLPLIFAREMCSPPSSVPSSCSLAPLGCLCTRLSACDVAAGECCQSGMALHPFRHAIPAKPASTTPHPTTLQPFLSMPRAATTARAATTIQLVAAPSPRSHGLASINALPPQSEERCRSALDNQCLVLGDGKRLASFHLLPRVLGDH